MMDSFKYEEKISGKSVRIVKCIDSLRQRCIIHSYLLYFIVMSTQDTFLWRKCYVTYEGIDPEAVYTISHSDGDKPSEVKRTVDGALCSLSNMIDATPGICVTREDISLVIVREPNVDPGKRFLRTIDLVRSSMKELKITFLDEKDEELDADRILNV